MSEGVRIRYMRLVLFFDLPVGTAVQRRNYRLFRKFLLGEGFLPLQESVYAKLVVNDGAASAAIARVRKKTGRLPVLSRSSELQRVNLQLWNMLQVIVKHMMRSIPWRSF